MTHQYRNRSAVDSDQRDSISCRQSSVSELIFHPKKDKVVNIEES